MDSRTFLDDCLECRWLTVNEKIFLIAVWRRYQMQIVGEGPTIWIFSELCGLSRSSLQRVIRNLREKGILNVNRTGRGSNYSIRYDCFQRQSPIGEQQQCLLFESAPEDLN